MNTLIDVIVGLAAILLFVSALIAIDRIARGPSQLDRSTAADLVVAIMIAAIGLWAARTHDASELNVLLLLSMLGFTGAVAIARMVADRVRHRRRHVQTHNPSTPSTAQEFDS